MNPDGSGQTRLTNSASADAFPAWSPDRQKIAFQSSRDGFEEVYVMNADGSEQTRLTTNAAFDGDPAWSSDGRKIAFVTGRDGNGEIYVMNADGSGQTNLTNSPDESESEPAWSPDGRRIAFVSTPNEPCCSFDIFLMNPDGSARTHVTDGLDPAWSPDGRRIAFFRGADIWVMNADGSGQTRLTNTGTYDRLPSWSPDGQRIAFESPRAGIGNEDIYVMNADGSGQTRLTDNPTIDRAPNWGTPGPPVITVAIDIKPGSIPNPINLRSQGTVPVAILGSASFNVHDVAVNTVIFAGASALRSSFEDVNQDGQVDLVLHFRTQELRLTPGSTEATLTGQTSAGVPIRGTDAVRIVP